jgi:hypothetical protein
MNDLELDDLLARSISPLPSTVSREAVLLARETMPARVRRGRVPRARWFFPAIVAGALALTAGASLSAVQLSQWPWVTMPANNVRNTVPIPVDWITDSGYSESCRAWIELRNTGDDDRATLDAAIQDYDWDGFGQKIYNAGTNVADDPDGEIRASEQLYPALFAFTKKVLPGVLIFGESGETVAVDALGMSCRADNP